MTIERQANRTTGSDSVITAWSLAGAILLALFLGSELMERTAHPVSEPSAKREISTH